MTCEVKFVQVTYTSQSLFMIPKHWKESDYVLKNDTLYFGDKEMDLQVLEAENDYQDEFDNEQEELEDGDDYHSEEYFECQETDSTAGSSDEDEED